MSVCVLKNILGEIGPGGWRWGRSLGGEDAQAEKRFWPKDRFFGFFRRFSIFGKFWGLEVYGEVKKWSQKSTKNIEIPPTC